MKQLIRELRRREVFRTAGLYVGICWILIEVASVLLPVFDAPEWLFRGIIIVAFAGFPVMLILAWFYDASAEGISLQADPTDTVVQQLGARRSDFAIIGLLVVALAISLTLNVRKDTPTTAAATEPVSVLAVAILEGADEASLGQVLEEALRVGLEAAPHISVLDLDKALQLARQERPGAVGLDPELARRVATSQGIDVLLTVSLQWAAPDIEIAIEAIDVAASQPLFEIDEAAVSQDAVLLAVADLSLRARKKFGDPTLRGDEAQRARGTLAASLPAARAYASARQLESLGQLDEAVGFYRQAVEADPQLGRALARLALAESALGEDESAQAHWAKALTRMDAMTEREQLLLRARYAADVAREAGAAKSIYAELVEKFPADVSARERYADVLFRELDFAAASKQLKDILRVFPGDTVYQARLALYAMYNGDWETATAEAAEAIAADADYGTAYLPLAMASLAQGEAETARKTFTRMAANAKRGYGASVAELGLADIDLYYGQRDSAQQRLVSGIDSDIARGQARMAALKSIALAQAQSERGQPEAAAASATSALELSDDLPVQVMAALVFLRADDVDAARGLIDALAARPEADSRAYAAMLSGMLLQRDGEDTAAILAMRDAISIADLWLIRFQICKAYLLAGSYPEALGELTTLNARRGEATAAFLDDMPSYHLLAELPYWTGRVQEAQNLRTAARVSYRRFLALRPQGGVLADDASERAARLE